MDWTIQDFGAAGEFIGSIAVVTLIYLAIQVKLARNEQRASVLVQRTTEMRELFQAAATSESLARAVSKATQSLGQGITNAPIEQFISKTGIDGAEAYQLVMWYTAYLRILATQTEIISDETQRAGNDRVLVGAFGSGLGRVFWDAIEASIHATNPAFHDRVSEQLERYDSR